MGFSAAISVKRCLYSCLMIAHAFSVGLKSREKHTEFLNCQAEDMMSTSNNLKSKKMGDLPHDCFGTIKGLKCSRMYSCTTLDVCAKC